MDNELMTQGVNLMLLGMGVVFVFLTLLVLVTSAMSKIVTSYFPEPPTESPPATTDSPQTEPRILAAIKLAIAEHRREANR